MTSIFGSVDKYLPVTDCSMWTQLMLFETYAEMMYGNLTNEVTCVEFDLIQT